MPSLRCPVLLALAVLTSTACAPKRADVRMAAGLAAQHSGDDLQAARHYRAALRLDPGVRGAANNLAAIAAGRDDLSAAMRLIEQELGHHAEDGTARLNRAALLLRAGEAERAEAELIPLAGLAGGVAPTRHERIRRRARARALLAVARLMAERPHDALLPLVSQPALHMLGDDATAADEAVARTTDYVLALSAARAGRYQEADRLLSSPERPHERRLAAAVRLRTEPARPADALRALGEPGAEDADVDRVLRGLATAAAGQTPTPVEVGEAAPRPLRVAALRLQAAASSASGRWAQALASLDAAIALGSPDADLWLDRAVALAHLGSLDEARRSVAGVLRDNPTHQRGRRLNAVLNLRAAP